MEHGPVVPGVVGAPGLPGQDVCDDEGHGIFPPRETVAIMVAVSAVSAVSAEMVAMVAEMVAEMVIVMVAEMVIVMVAVRVIVMIAMMVVETVADQGERCAGHVQGRDV